LRNNQSKNDLKQEGSENKGGRGGQNRNYHKEAGDKDEGH